MAKRSIAGPLILIGVFGIPLLTYLFLFVGTEQQFNRVPYQYDIGADGDTLWHTLPDFSLVDVEGNTVTREDLVGNICITGFISPDGEDIKTVALIGNLRRSYDNIDWDKNPDIRFIFISTSDSLPALQAYADSVDLDPRYWMFLSGDDDEVNRVAQSFHIEEFENRSDSKPFTSQTVILTDKTGKARKYYIGTDLSEERKIQEDLIALMRLDYGA